MRLALKFKIHLLSIPFGFILFLGVSDGMVYGQNTVSGRIISRHDSLSIPYAVVSLPAYDLWAITDEQGRFSLKNVVSGNALISVRCLGFATQSTELQIDKNLSDLIFVLQEDNLTLNEVVVTSKQGKADLNTSFVMDRTALDHMQMLNVTDVTSLLPGGKTNRMLDLTSGSQAFSVTGTNSEMGNALFGVGVEVDGVRLSNNAIPTEGSSLKGVDTRNIASSNIERIEVVTGIPSVEYGDATNGMVRISTRKGVSPFILDLMTKPNTKQIALSKGVDLGNGKGILNFSLEHTRSVSDLASPYTSYARNTLSLNYVNTFAKESKQPLEINFGIAGNKGGYDSRSDPDRFVDTYSKSKDNVIRTNFSIRWLLNKPWITNLEVSGTGNYNDQLSEERNNKSASASVAANHATEEGYFVGQLYDSNPKANVILIEPGYWYEHYYTDSKLLNYSGRMKATLANRWGRLRSHLLFGGEYTGSGNLGKGAYYGQLRYAPTWREYRYRDIPFNNNYAVYLEEKLHVSTKGESYLDVVGGLRWDVTSIRNSVYGAASNLSPRFNAEYTLWKKAKRAFEDLSVKIGWGKTVKLPSFSTLFPTVGYRDMLTFAPGTTSDGSTYYAYYTIPTLPEYNPGLKWQYNIQYEAGVNLKVRGVRLFIGAAQDKTYRPYGTVDTYRPFTYKFTDQSNLEGSAIPIANRIYSVDQYTGVVTVRDKTGILPSEVISYKEVTRGVSNSAPVNGSSVRRRRLQWIIDFPKIMVLRTQIRLDGNWYFYRGIDETITAYMPNSTLNMANGNPYKYIGFFVGGAYDSNGRQTKNLNLNLTTTTHIPELRLIFSTRIEGTLQQYVRELSEYGKGDRGFVLESRDGYIPSLSETNIYKGDQFVGVYPEYYISLDAMDTPVPFAERFLWAKNNDKALYNELAKMVVRTNYNYKFNASRLSAYFSANIGITKEIGRIATITFNATNFISNMATYRNSGMNTAMPLFGSSYIPAFYYGLSLRLKI